MILKISDININKRYDWYIKWDSNLGATTLNLYNKTYAEAKLTAEEFGFEYPKWWQIFRKHSTEFTTV